MRRTFLVLVLLTGLPAWSAPAKPQSASKPPVKNSNHNFDSQVVEGEIYRPDYSVVTGDAPGEGWGVLRLRPDFNDHAVSDNAEQKASAGGRKR